MFKLGKKDILNGNILEQLLLFFFPIFVGYLIQQIYTFADSIILGHLLGTNALASIGGSNNSIMTIITNMISGISAAIMVMIGQYYGSGDRDGVYNVIKSSIFSCVLIGGILSVTLFFSAPLLLTLLQEPLETYSDSLIYLRLYGLSLIPLLIYNTGLSLLRGLGQSQRPIHFILFVAIIKIALDLLLAGSFNLGVLGIGLATFISYLLSALLILYIMATEDDIYSFDIRDFGYSEEVKSLIIIALPFVIQTVMFALPSTLIQAKINSYGKDVVAGYYAYCNADSLFWCFDNAVATSIITLVSQNYGNKRYDRVVKIMRVSLLFYLFGALGFGLFFHLFSKQAIMLFSGDTNVIEIGRRMLSQDSKLYWLYTFGEVIGSSYKAQGKAKQMMYIGLVTVSLSRTLYTLFYPANHYLRTVLVFPLSWLLTSIAYLAYYVYKNYVATGDNNY